MVFCCHSLQNLVADAGGRGFSVVVSALPRGYRFHIQMRAVSAADEARLPRVPRPDMPEHVTLSGSFVIRYCPSCGKRLDDLVSANPKAYAELAAAHKDFLHDLSRRLSAPTPPDDSPTPLSR